MFRYWLLRVTNNLTILTMLMKHLKEKWRLEVAGVTSIFMMIALGILLPAAASVIYGYDSNFALTAFLYVSLATIAIVYLLYRNSNLTLSKILYEIRYFNRLFKFMRMCYKNIILEYNLYSLNHDRPPGDKYHGMYMDLKVVGTIFFRIFTLYFYNMKVKMKTSEPDLIDINEMASLLDLRTFSYEDFYSEVFFKPSIRTRETPYEQVLVDIFDTVLNTLYKEPWFTEYYSSEYLFNMVRHVLDNWYGKMVYHETFHNNQLHYAQ